MSIRFFSMGTSGILGSIKPVGYPMPKRPTKPTTKRPKRQSKPPAGNIQVLATKPQVKLTGRPRKYQTVAQFNRIIDEYFEQVEKDGQRPTVTGLAYLLDLDRRQLIDYQGKPLFNNAITKAKRRIEASYEQNALSGKSNAAVSMFIMKNNYGYKDKIEIDNQVSVSVEHTFDPLLAQKFNDLLKGETVDPINGLIEQ